MILLLIIVNLVHSVLLYLMELNAFHAAKINILINHLMDAKLVSQTKFLIGIKMVANVLKKVIGTDKNVLSVFTLSIMTHKTVNVQSAHWIKYTILWRKSVFLAHNKDLWLKIIHALFAQKIFYIIMWKTSVWNVKKEKFLTKKQRSVTVLILFMRTLEGNALSVIIQCISMTTLRLVNHVLKTTFMTSINFNASVAHNKSHFIMGRCAVHAWIKHILIQNWVNV